jgi:hypothetical protein
MKHSFKLLVVAVLMVGCFGKAWAGNITLDWSSSSSSTAAGYFVYYGTTSGIYPYRINVGNATSVTISNLVPGTTYYLAATTYDSSGDQSSFSGEVNFTVPVSMPEIPLTMLPGAGGGNPASLQFPVQTGYWYEIQATSDFVHWTSIWQSVTATVNSTMQFTDPDTNTYSLRCYRLVQH